MNPARIVIYGALVALVCLPALAQDLPIDASIATDAARLKLVQTNLNAIGINVGKPDGNFGKASKRGFQRFMDKFGVAALDPAAELRLEQVVRTYTQAPWDVAPATPVPFLVDTGIKSSWDVREAIDRCADGSCTVAPGLLATGDLTGDGLPELVYATLLTDLRGEQLDRPSSIVIMSPLGAAPAERGRYQVLPVTMADGKPLVRVHANRAIIRDLNGDGIGDLYVAVQGHDHPPYKGGQDVLLLSGPDGLVDVSYDNIPVENSMGHGIDAGDLDGDGDLDLIVTTNYGQKKIEPSVLWNDGHGKFTHAKLETILEPSLARFLLKQNPDFSKYATIKIADIDADGFQDLILCAEAPEIGVRYSGMTLSRIAFGDGSGKWTRANTIELPTDRFGNDTITSNVSLIDYDQDGKTDLVMTLSLRDRSRGSFEAWRGQYQQILRNQGGRKFVDVTDQAMFPQGYDATALSYAEDTLVVDLDSDGDSDLVLVSADPWAPWEKERRAPKVAINDGKGHFLWADPARNARDSSGRMLAAVDADNDGDIDIVGLSLLGKDAPDGDYLAYGFKVTFYQNVTTR